MTEETNTKAAGNSFAFGPEAGSATSFDPEAVAGSSLHQEGGLIMEDQPQDVIVIGAGAAGAAVASELVAAGRQVLLLERGTDQAADTTNSSGIALFRGQGPHLSESWFGPDGDPFLPQTIYAPGGNTMIWGGVLERMREAEFEGLPMQEGRSPDWGLRYSDLAPWYDKAELLFRVHGQAGLDPSEPPRASPYPFPPPPITPFLDSLGQGLRRQGLHPYPLPLSRTNTSEAPTGDARGSLLAPAMATGRLRLLCGARVRSIVVSPDGRRVQGVEAEMDGQRWLFRGRQVVLTAGAVNSPVILLRSRSATHPNGLANSSDQVGRNLMKPQMSVILQRASTPNDGRYDRSWGITDFINGDRNVAYTLGSIQTGGGVFRDSLFAASPPVLSLVARLLPGAALEWLANRSFTWWAMTPVLPDPANRVSLRGEQVHIDFLPNCREAHDRLVYRWLGEIQKVDDDPLTPEVRRTPVYPRGESPLALIGHACGTCRMGCDPDTSVVDLQGRCHGLENLWIADASVFPGCPTVSPGLTVIANALRVGNILAKTE
jgi:choline dehydrogenase-like flavoprotein